MEFAEAVTTAIEMEEKVRSFYAKTATELESPVARKIFNTLAEEEEGHIDYLNRQLEAVKQTGNVTDSELKTVVPDKLRIDDMVTGLENVPQPLNLDSDIASFRLALEMEKEVAGHYRKLIEHAADDFKGFFEEFLEIEEAHENVLQAELFAAKSSGVWFDFIEFDQEAG